MSDVWGWRDYARGVLGAGATASDYQRWLTEQLEEVTEDAAAEAEVRRLIDEFAAGMVSLLGPDRDADGFPYFQLALDVAQAAQRVAGLPATASLRIEQPLIPNPDRVAQLRHVQELAEGHPRYQVAPYVYRYFDGAGELLYVGYTATPLKRSRAHSRTAPWFPDAVLWTVERFDTEELARAEELRAIREEDPVHNKAGREKRSA